MVNKKVHISFDIWPQRLLIVLLIFACSFLSNAQNLVQNSEFDQYQTYLDENKNLVVAPDFWYYSKSGQPHPIYLFSNRKNNSDQGKNINYIGLPMLPMSTFAFTRINGNLKGGKLYKLSLQVKSYGYINCFTDILAGFSKKEPTGKSVEFLCKYWLKFPENYTYDSLVNRWTEVKSIFEAQGDEKFLIIGTPNNSEYCILIDSIPCKYRTIIKNPDGYYLNYYIDHVSLLPYDTVIISENRTDFNDMKLGKNIILKNIYFEFAKWELLPESYPELNLLVDFLAKNNIVRIEISGHTDNLGSDEYNKVLSLNRAKSVVDYLIAKGISPDRLRSNGYGNTIPISDNETDEGRQLNRRVEIKIIQ